MNRRIVFTSTFLMVSIIFNLAVITTQAGKAPIPTIPQLLSSGNHHSSNVGISVATDGSYIVIGASGVIADGHTFAGAVYVYDASETLIATLTSPNPEVQGYFGCSVAIGGDYIVVGAYDEDIDEVHGAGRAYIYYIPKLSPTKTLPVVTLTSYPVGVFSGRFGNAVATDGVNVVVGAYWGSYIANYGEAYIYSVSGEFIAKLITPNPEGLGYYGYSVGISGTNTYVGAKQETISGHDNAGRVYVYTKSGEYIDTLISPQPKANGYFGSSIAVEGEYIIIGAPGEGHGGNVYIYDANYETSVFKLTSVKGQKNGQFGFSVAIDSTNIVVGAPGEKSDNVKNAGNAYIFCLDGSYYGTLTTPNPTYYGSFGCAVAIEGKIVIGACYEPSGSYESAGNVYITNNIS